MPFPRIVKAAVARRDELLDCAQGLFAANGYDATSINEIVAKVGVSKGAFYHHFESKEDLLEALACRYAEETAARASRIIADPTLDPFARLIAFLGEMRRHKLQSATELRATFEPLFRAENVQLHERTHRAVVGVVRPVLTAIIAEGVAELTFNTPDPESAADVIMHLLVSNRDLIGALYRTRSRAEFSVLSEQLLRKITFVGTVIDRMLGLPEGSITLLDRDTLCILAGSIPETESAA